MAIYCDYTKIGRYKIRLSKISEKATLVRDKDNGDIVIFKTTLKVCDPVTEFVYDPFIGTGTTAVACKEFGCKYIGSELSKAQCEYARERIENIE